MANRTYTSAFSALRATMEVCSQKVSEAYSQPLTDLDIYTGELPPGHRPTDRRQRYYVTEHQGDLIVALPGTTHPFDWSSNLRVTYTPIDGSPGADSLDGLEEVPCAHAGFYFRSGTVPSEQLLQLAADKGCRLVFTGHSLGGAVANLCALTALNAQRRALTAAASTADLETAARCSRNDATSCELCKQLPANMSAAVTEAHCSDDCSSKRNFSLSPQATMVEVLAISFASPVFANAALARFIEGNGWEECFVNLVVPEDYCLNLFNNVLTSAPQPKGRLPSRATSSRFKATKKQTLYSEPQEPSEDPIPEAPIDTASLPTAVSQQEHEACSRRGISSDSSSDITASHNLIGTPQQPLVSAMAGKSPGKMRSKRQLCFAEPLHQGLETRSVTPAAALACNTAAATTWQEDQHLPRTTSTASLLSEGSSSSTRSWTLLAYLPGSISRSLSSWSGSSTSSMRDSSSGGSASSSSHSCEDLLGEQFHGWGVRRPCSAADSSCEISSSSSSDSGDNRLDGFLDALAAPFVSHTNSLGAKADKQVTDNLDHVAGSAESACVGLTPAKAWHQRLLQTVQTNRKAALRRSLSSASLTILRQGHSKLLQPLALLQVTGRWSLVASLLPNMRSIVIASRAVANAAHKVGEKAFNVPLGALEAGLIRALRPPMYESVGQQWILSATGLVPQHQPIHQYPKHVSDVYWHKELLLVAFKEHSIVFYKRRLLQQASRR